MRNNLGCLLLLFTTVVCAVKVKFNWNEEFLKAQASETF
jgi:hypothetical protein